LPEGSWSRQAGAEPLPGYRLLAPLGKGGFGEVWKCEAPGGLLKAIKFIGASDPLDFGDSAAADLELQSLQRIKAIRHPFLLSLERVEISAGVLLIVMELADRSLGALQADYQDRGQPGIPRAELLRYLLEAAEALDVINFEHGLQHLDVKPDNLFLVGKHIKVADFGLVHSLGEEGQGLTPRHGGFTPRYAAPEIWEGTVSRHTDQYSLACVYQQLLTGMLPFAGQSSRQFMVQHMGATPNLSPLPAWDQPVVARALAKDPAGRFESCLSFVEALLDAAPAEPAGAPAESKPAARRHGLRRPVLPAAPEGSSERTMGPGAARTTEVPVVPGPSARAPQEHGAEAGTGATAPPASAGASLPGYHFLQCLNQGPLGELWRVQDLRGRERRALWPLGGPHAPEVVARLHTLRHPALPEADVFWGPSGRMVLVSDCPERTLWDRFEQCRATGACGIPRPELLAYLRQAAETLDALTAAHGLPHLALNPRRLLLNGDRLQVADFGLVPLLWLPTGQPAAVLNPRYSAPELCEARPCPTADSYSLALIYAEMITGIAPRPVRGAGTARPAGPRSAPPRAPARLDLDLLPAPEREVLARALHAEAPRRFPTCGALVAALEEANGLGARPEPLGQRLLPILPFAHLLGESAVVDAALPTLRQLLAELAPEAAQPASLQGPPGLRYAVGPDGVWEHRCPVRLFPGALRLKLQGFHQQWGARVLHRDDTLYRCRIDLAAARRLWGLWTGRQPQLEVEIVVPPPRRRADGQLAEARLRIRSIGGSSDSVAQVLAATGPRVFESLRTHLQAAPERRSQPRWPCSAPLHVYPTRADGQVEPPLAGSSLDISCGGVGFVVPRPPATGWVYLHWHTSSRLASFAILARVVRVEQGGLDNHEVGAAF
jgi:serine/threonine protein kinase